MSTDREQAQRNQNPHKPARLAMFLWNREYAAQGGGSMDFWDKLRESQKQICREGIAEILKAPDEVTP
jgi:hypothetical protein